MNVYVIGLGFIGLPMAAWVAQKGHIVLGIDVNEDVINSIKQGHVKIFEEFNGKNLSEITADLIKNGFLKVSTELKRIDQSPSVFILAVGIADMEDGTQDINPLKKVISSLVSKLIDGDLIIIRNTMIPGTCDNFMIPLIESMNKKINIAYCPETISEGHAFEEFEQNPIVLAGKDSESYQIAEKFFRTLSNSPIYKASNIKTAEMTKVVQNISRDVNIALVNELSDICSKIGVDIFELQRLASTHPRVKILEPGPGVGGYCIPNAYHYLIYSIKNNAHESTELMKTARKINSEKPKNIVEFIKKLLNENGKEIKNSKVSIIGLAMKDYCNDCRHSPAIEIAQMLESQGACVKAFDPMIDNVYPFQVQSINDCIDNTDCILIAAKQPGIDLDKELTNLNLECPIIDTRNLLETSNYKKIYKI